MHANKATRIRVQIEFYFVLQMKWMLEKVPAVKSAVEEDRCLLGTVDSWLLWVRLCTCNS